MNALVREFWFVMERVGDALFVVVIGACIVVPLAVALWKLRE